MGRVAEGALCHHGAAERCVVRGCSAVGRRAPEKCRLLPRPGWLDAGTAPAGRRDCEGDRRRAGRPTWRALSLRRRPEDRHRVVACAVGTVRLEAVGEAGLHGHLVRQGRGADGVASQPGDGSCAVADPRPRGHCAALHRVEGIPSGSTAGQRRGERPIGVRPTDADRADLAGRHESAPRWCDRPTRWRDVAGGYGGQPAP